MTRLLPGRASEALSRRRFLRGSVNGAAFALSLPILDCMLDVNGKAFAATGQPRPVRFGTWIWGCGMHPPRWNPQTTGRNYEITPELEPLRPHKAKINVLTDYKVLLDGSVNEPHYSAVWALRTGTAPIKKDVGEEPSLDVLIADAMGGGTRYRSLEIAATGLATHSFSRRNAANVNPAIASPAELYARLFGSGFVDPNAADFKPDPQVMLRKGALSAVGDERKALMASLGAADRERLDQYFTSLRAVENQLAVELEKPAPADACRVPAPFTQAETPPAGDVDVITRNHKLMAEMLAMGLACNQTRVFNMLFSDTTSSLRRKSETVTHHTLTHEEPMDPELGYQKQVHWFTMRSMEALATFIEALDGVKEGDGTLLDHTLVYAHSDASLAKVHSTDSLPVVLAGAAGGKVRTGTHIAGGGEPISQVGLTMMQIMGAPVESWGTKSMRTTKTVGAVLA